MKKNTFRGSQKVKHKPLVQESVGTYLETDDFIFDVKQLMRESEITGKEEIVLVDRRKNNGSAEHAAKMREGYVKKIKEEAYREFIRNLYTVIEEIPGGQLKHSDIYQVVDLFMTSKGIKPNGE